MSIHNEREQNYDVTKYIFKVSPLGEYRGSAGGEGGKEKEIKRGRRRRKKKESKRRKRKKETEALCFLESSQPCQLPFEADGL